MQGAFLAPLAHHGGGKAEVAENGGGVEPVGGLLARRRKKICQKERHFKLGSKGYFLHYDTWSSRLTGLESACVCVFALTGWLGLALEALQEENFIISQTSKIKMK